MEERNPQTLQQAIRQLPELSPPSAVWSGIRRQLEHDQADVPLKAALRELPLYNPPDALWVQIESAITEEMPAKRRSLVRRLWPAVAAAAVISGLFLVKPDLFFGSTQAVEYASARLVSEELVDPMLLERDWREDEQGFQFVEDLCNKKPFMCSNPDVQGLKLELAELTEAKSRLEVALGDYGTDLYLIQQLKEIELERTELLKEMLERMI